jgi:hypothetical protein
MNTNDELKEHAPGLYELRRKDDGMRVPDDYFNDFEARIFERIEQEGIRRNNNARSPMLSVLRSRYIIAAAAAIALLIAAVWFFRQATPNEASLFAANDVELLPEDATFYLLENAQEFEIEQLASIEEMEIQHPASTDQNLVPSTQHNTEAPVNDASEEELNQILKDMSEEELESLIHG